MQGAQEVDARFDELAKSSKALVVDLAKVSFLASLGVRTLMLSAKTLIRRGGDMAVCGANENVEKVLRTTGFNEVAGIYPDYDSAAAHVAGEACRLLEQESMSEPSRDLLARLSRHGRGRLGRRELGREPGERLGPRRGDGIRDRSLPRGAVPQRGAAWPRQSREHFRLRRARRRASSSSSTTASRSIRRSRPAKRISGPTDDFDIGGYGTGSMQKFSRRMSYRRSDGMNRLVLEFDAGRDADAAGSRERNMTT